jgi:hypothetical protein
MGRLEKPAIGLNIFGFLAELSKGLSSEKDGLAIIFLVYFFLGKSSRC